MFKLQASRLARRACGPESANVTRSSRADGRCWAGETPGLLFGSAFFSEFRLKTDVAGFVFILCAIERPSSGLPLRLFDIHQADINVLSAAGLMTVHREAILAWL